MRGLRGLKSLFGSPAAGATGDATANAKKYADNGDAEWQKRLGDLLLAVALYPANKADVALQGIKITPWLSPFKPAGVSGCAATVLISITSGSNKKEYELRVRDLRAEGESAHHAQLEIISSFGKGPSGGYALDNPEDSYHFTRDLVEAFKEELTAQDDFTPGK